MIPDPKQVRYHDGLDDTLFHCISPMSLQDRTIFTEKQHLATHATHSPRTVSSGEQWCKFVVRMGKKNFTDKQQLACSSRTVSPDEHTGFACSSRTVSPDEQCYRLICASCTHVPLGTQVFQLPQAASKPRSVP